MIAGATTNARTAIGTVTEAQMPRIFGKEYCAELSAAPIGLGSDCVVVMPPASAGTPAGTSPCGLQIAGGRTPAGDARVHLEGDAHGAA
jgi:hypothetical protein